jgi:hypothetical protein
MALPAGVEGLSYSAQYDVLLTADCGASRKKPALKPSPEAQSQEPGATRIPFSDVWAVKKKGVFNWGSTTLNDIAVRTTILGGSGRPAVPIERWSALPPALVHHGC